MSFDLIIMYSNKYSRLNKHHRLPYSSLYMLYVVYFSIHLYERPRLLLLLLLIEINYLDLFIFQR